MATNLADFTTAQYIPQRLPQYQGNPFIEAIPPLGTEESIQKELLCLPYFDPEQRNWRDIERLQMIAQLAGFLFPLERHIQLTYALDTLIRQGYIGRAPRSKASAELFSKLRNTPISQMSSIGQLSAEISSSLTGPSGMGKTSALKRLLSRLPRVIYHPEYGYYQVTYIHIEMPYDGASVAGLAHSIIRKLDNIFPEANYYDQYCKGSSGAETLMNHAARLLAMHGVGILIVDEVQNLENSPKNRKGLMTLLVSASNELSVPILFVGTSKARALLSLNFRQARRSIGHCLPLWERLSRGDAGTPGEWELFSTELLRYQWTRNPVDVSPHLVDLLYHYSQGIIDIAIKLVAAAQCRAILSGEERLSAALIASVAENELSMVAPMIDALRRNDVEALQRYDDIAPLALDKLFQDIQLSYTGAGVAGASTKPGTGQYNNMVAAALEKVGFDTQTAMGLANTAIEDGATDALDGVKRAITASKGGTKRRTKSQSGSSLAEIDTSSLAPRDYRRALSGTEGSVFERLGALGMLPDLNAIFAW